MGRNILYVAYLYPPVGGRGLPGAQRTVKFVRYLDCDNAHVLTVKPDYYPDYSDLNNNLELPINNEIIHRTKVFDLFNLLIKIKKYFRRLDNSKPGEASSKFTNSSITDKSSEIWYEQSNKSKWQLIKDFISNVFYFPENASTWIVPAVFKGFQIIKKHKISVLFATGSPWSALTIAYILSRLTNVPLVVDFRDPWIENPFHVSKGKLLDDYAVRLEKSIIEHARLVSVNTEELRHAFLRRYPEIDSKKFITLPNGYDISDYQHISHTRELHLNTESKNNLVLAHAGFLYGTRDPSPIIEAIEKISRSRDINANIIFWQMGKISLNYDFHEKFKALLSEKKIVLIDQLPYDQCLEKLSRADVLLNIQPKTKTQVPSKIYDYLCLNLPILTITPVDGALGNMVRRYDFGYIFAPEDIDGISACLLGLWRRKQRDGRITANYPNRELFDVCRIANSLSESLANIGV